MEGFFYLALMGFATALIANSKGRNPVGWFLFGFFFHVIALIVAVFVTDTKEIDGKIRSVDSDRRRLKEQLRQERMKNESFRTEARERLDRHDVELGLDTRPAPLALTSAGPPALAAASESEDDLWYFEHEGRARGPESASILRQRLRRGELPAATLVWRAGLDDWTPADAFPELFTLA